MSREIKITPSILNADLTNLGYEISRIASVSDLIHLDVMDNIFVPNFTFDFERASQIIKECPIASVPCRCVHSAIAASLVASVNVSGRCGAKSTSSISG